VEKPVVLRIENIDDAYEAYWNGTKLGGAGSFPPDYAPAAADAVEFTVPKDALKSGHNLVAIRIYDHENRGGFKASAPAVLAGENGINLNGVWLCMKYEIAQMLKQGGGAIVNNASNFGLVGSNGMPAYSAAKHGVIGLTKTAAIEYAQRGIRVNAVCPGPVQTPLVDKIIARQPEIVDAITSREPIGRMGQPEEIATAVLWLCSDEASFVIGSVLPVDGGYVAQ
jgi:NAD(P)-dependent dehydrogenase (short-subunit alcohol dehydrogenase family)